MSALHGITDEALSAILEPGERPLYRAYAQQMPAQLWKRFAAGFFNVHCSLVLTPRRLLVLRREARWFSTEFTPDVLHSLPLEQITRVSSQGALGANMLTVHRADGVRLRFEIRTTLFGDPAQRAFVEEMPTLFNTQKLPRD